ncbi:MAG: hypothetical protein E7638_05905 [Ruminococcaceae bacterium]|nr:hypothetical protein [Oscillospiraceae bacterium]
MSYIYKGKKYTLTVTEERFTVECEGVEICSLIPTSPVMTVTVDGNGTCPEDYTEHPDLDEETVSFETEGDSLYRWRTKSSLWEKVYTLSCDPDGFTYTVTVTGEGNIGKVTYFANGNSLQKNRHCMTDTQNHSTYGFYEYYFPCPSPNPANAMRRTTGSDFHSFFELLIPPPYVYSFHAWGVDTRMGLGLFAKAGEYNFAKFDYNRVKRGEQFFFHLSTDLEGHTNAKGEFTLPAIRGFFGEDDDDIIRQYCDYHYSTGLCRKNPRENMPRWWYGPIVCGWHEQYTLMENGIPQKDYATQAVYEHIAEEIEKHNIRPTILIVDDKWQKTYGDCLPDTEKWPDMRAFTDKMHARGIHTLLWFRLWGGEGLPEEERLDMPKAMNDWGDTPYADPTSEAYRAHLKKILHTLLSPDEGCMNADGLKLDYSLVMPLGKAAKSRGGIYGVEMTKTLYKLIYDTAKEIKPDCLINASPAHPYFDEVCDQARLHDCCWSMRNQAELMAERARIFRAAMPGVLIDTDSANYASRPDAMRYFRAMPEIGIPDIYQFSNSCHITLKDEDWREIERIFNDYSDRVDKMFADK